MLENKLPTHGDIIEEMKNTRYNNLNKHSSLITNLNIHQKMIKREFSLISTNKQTKL